MRRVSEPEWPVLHAILAQGQSEPTHRQLAELSGVSQRAVGNVISDFRAARLVEGGRPAKLGPGLGLCVGISLGAESLRGVVLDANGDCFCEVEDDLTPEQLLSSPRVLLKRMGQITARVLGAALDEPRLWGPTKRELRLLGVAAALPFPLDRSKRPVGRTLRDGGWRRKDPETGRALSLPQQMASALGEPFTVARCHALNDVSAAALAVSFRNGRAQAGNPSDDQWKVELVIRVGGSLGAATIVVAPHSEERLSFIDSRLIEGTNGLAGELGHLPIGRKLIEEINSKSHGDLAKMDFDGWQCSCGRSHHLEAFASGRAVVRRLQASGMSVPEDGRGRMSMLRAALEEPDELQVGAVTDIGRILGRALAGPILMLDPYRITITGSLATEPLVDGIGRERDLWANAIKDAVTVEQKGGSAGRFVGAQGAALAVIRRAVYRGFLDRRVVPTTIRFGDKDLTKLLARNR